MYPRNIDVSAIESSEDIILRQRGYTKEYLAIENKATMLGALTRDPNAKTTSNGRGAVAHARGLRKVVPPHMLANHEAHVVIQHFGQGKTPRSMKTGGFMSLSAEQKRGNRKQFDGGHSGGKSSFSLTRRLG